MKQLKSILSETTTSFYRFQAFIKEAEGTKRTVGTAYLQDGQTIYTLRLWTFLNEKFFLVPTLNDPTKFLVKTREPIKTPDTKNKYFWNVVGNAKANETQTVLEVNLDLFEKKVYLNIIPSASSMSRGLPNQEINDVTV